MFLMITLNKGDYYFGHCPLSWGFCKCFGNLTCSYKLLSFELSWGNAERATVIMWEAVGMNITLVTLQSVHYDPHLHITSLDGHSSIMILLNVLSMQWGTPILRSRIVEGYTMWHYMILLDPTSRSQFSTASVNLKRSMRQLSL